MTASKHLGEIHISDDVVAEIAGRSAIECYGVVGIGSPGISAGVKNLLSADRFKKGVRVLRESETVKLVLFVIGEYGTNLSEVAHNLMTQVKYNVERLTGFKVESVDVKVQDIKITR